MIKWYSLNNQEPTLLPESIRMSNGLTRTDSSTFTEEEIAEAGYVLSREKPICGVYEKVIWNGSDWEIIDMTEQEKESVHDQKKKEVLALRKDRLDETDWIIIRAIEQNKPIDPNIIAYRQALRDLTETTTDFFQVNFPILSTNTISEGPDTASIL